MKTLEQVQAAIDEIREVCHKHGIVLIGTCAAEGIYGEITISDDQADGLKLAGWKRINTLQLNAVAGRQGALSLDGIGDFVDSPPAPVFHIV